MADRHPYLDLTGAKEYIDAVRGQPPTPCLKELFRMLRPGSTLLELGIGAGNDLLELSRNYDVIGSDYSEHFVAMFKAQRKSPPVMTLDALRFKTELTFDCIFSNKVLHHLSVADLKISIKRQLLRLNKGGLLFHTFWSGREKSFADKLHFNKYEQQEIRHLFHSDCDSIETGLFDDLNENDSFYAALIRDG